MQQEVVFAGFGGQGILFAAELLAYGAMLEGREVAWVPSYGPEMRGGTARATVVISDREIGSLVVAHPGVVVAMNQPSFDRFSRLIKPMGLLLYNRSLITPKLRRADLRVIAVPASDAATDLGNDRLSNMVMLGARLAADPLVRIESPNSAPARLLPARQAYLLGPDEAAPPTGGMLPRHSEAA